MIEIELKTEKIADLAGKGYFIPKYQRGFRWTKSEVEDLLNDITDFMPEKVKNTTEETWYCLQPLVLRTCSEKFAEKHKLNPDLKWYEVIDGQQRLTTIYLISLYINNKWRGDEKDPTVELQYETRSRTQEFLSQINIPQNERKVVNNENVDFHYISAAFSAIHQWVLDKKNPNFYKDDFIRKFLNLTKVIWYETQETDSNAIFSRINKGKISLTNAELVKALFLRSDNIQKQFDSNGYSADGDKVRLKQIEIAGEWDRMEYTLQKSKFWKFIFDGDNKEFPTRMDFILRLMLTDEQEKERGKKENDDYFLFKVFQNRLKDKGKKEIEDQWLEVKKYFQILEEWYIDKVFYHKIGFLVAVGKNIKGYITEFEKKSKDAFSRFIHKEIEDYFENISVGELDYNKGKDKLKIKHILLLHNIQTVLDNPVDEVRFPWYRYKDPDEKWDIEHIHSVSEKMPKEFKTQKLWLTDAAKYLDKKPDLKQKAEEFKDGDGFDAFYADIIEYFAEGHYEDEMNGISNLALLDASTNRSYKNAIFPVKRQSIIEREKTGTFVPICTKNVFFKYYSDNIEHMHFWNTTDRNNYFKNITETLKVYSTIKEEGESNGQ